MKAAKLFFILLCLAALAAPAAAAGGAGTAASPYIIETAAELQSIHNNLGAYYRLANDIDLSGVTWTPIGTGSAGFYGELDGNGKTIKNLELSVSSSSAGLFYRLTSGATIKDLTLENCHVESTTQWCGCLVGSIIMSDTAHETATLNNINMDDCSSSSSRFYVGVLCGLIYTSADVEIVDCTLTNCFASGESYIGVLLGGSTGVSSTTITSCIIMNSHATSISGDNVAIFCGMCSTAGTNIIMSNCLVDSCISVTLKNHAGSFCGTCSSGSVTITKCTTKNSIINGINNIGGCIGYSSGSGANIAITEYTITDSTILSTNNYAGGISGGFTSDVISNIADCSVSDSTILANSYAATICPAFS